MSSRTSQTREGSAAKKGTPAADLFDTHGFKTDVARRVDDKGHHLTSSRMATISLAGAILFPIYALLDISTARGALPGRELAVMIGLRVLAGVLLAGLAWLFYKQRFSPPALKIAEVSAFTAAGLITSFIVAVMWDVVPDYYIGIGQLIVVRCVLLPGGPRSAIPTCVGLLLSLPVGLLLFSGGDLSLFTGPSGERIVTACSGLAGFAAIGMIGSFVYDKALKQTVVSQHQDRYRLDEFIDQGGMGKVYKGWDQRLGRACAIKVISAGEEQQWEVARQRFEQEAQKTSQLSGSHVVEIYDYGVTYYGDMYYAMEFLEGYDVAALVRMAGPLPAERVIHLGRQACLGLAVAHQRGLLHRDVKPANLFITQRDEDPDFLKVLDFGLVKAVAQAAGTNLLNPGRAADGDEGPTDLTMAGMLIGTPAYLAPEQILGEPVNAPADVYALGAVLYFMLTGEEAFVGRSNKDLFEQKMKGPPQPPSARTPDLPIPPDLAAVIQRCMAFLSDDRYQSMGELRSALESCKAAGGWTAVRARSFWVNVGKDALEQMQDWNADSAEAATQPVDGDASTRTVGLGPDFRPRT